MHTFSQKWWKRRFSNSFVFFQKMHLFKIPVNLSFCKYQKIYCFSNLLHHKDHMSTEIWWENSFKKLLRQTIMILPFSVPKLRMTSELWQNAGVIFYINRQNNSNKIFSTVLTFYPTKMQIKCCVFKWTECIPYKKLVGKTFLDRTKIVWKYFSRKWYFCITIFSS